MILCQRQSLLLLESDPREEQVMLEKHSKSSVVLRLSAVRQGKLSK
jgi:hypothetical protein